MDTNVWVSALIAPTGTPATLLDRLQGHVLIASEEMLDEVQRVLHYDRIAKKYNLTPVKVSSYLDNIRQKVVLFAADPPDSTIVEADPSDDKFLAIAVKGKADCIVSGDRHLLRLTEYQGIPILSPATLLAIVESILSHSNGIGSGT